MRDAAERDDDRRAAVGGLVAEICRYMDWPLGHAHFYDPGSGRLVPSMNWHQGSDGTYDPLIEATADLRLSLAEGLPGRALASRRPEWIPDLPSDPGFLRAEPAGRAGVRAGVAVPLFSNGDVGGVLEFFSADQSPLSDDVLRVLDYIGVAWSRVLGHQHLEVQLGHARDRHDALVHAAADAIISADETGVIRSWNPAAERMFGYRADEVVGKPLPMIMPEPYRERHRSAFSRAVDSDGLSVDGPLELAGLKKDGRVFPIELTLATWHSDRRYFAGILRDITERKGVEEELRMISSATAHVRDAIVISTTGSSGRGPTILYVNAAFSRMTGYAESEALGRSFRFLAGEDTSRELLQEVNHRIARGEAAAVELTAYRADGSSFLMDWHASPIYEPDGDVRYFVSIQRDITEERRAQQALRRADRDPLTELANRQVLERHLERELAAGPDGGRFALLFLDLDGFKAVNDEYGHVVGDELLTAAARRLERTVRPGDTLSRFGGDEFVILLGYVTDISDVIMVAERVRERLSEPFDIQGRKMSIAASIGVALSEGGYRTPKGIMEAADAAMYEAKRRGKGRVEFADRDLYFDVVSLMGLREDLRGCVESEELELRYQPLVDLAKGSIVGFEALVRWRHPEEGLIPPDRFIPLAEESGVILDIGRWVLRRACADAVKWPPSPSTGEPLVLSVNLSMRELGSEELVATVGRVLNETGLEPGRLQLELTESVLVETLDPVRDRIEALRALGITVCIDDFGTGYSSLGYLRHFPVDKIKIDRLFVRHLDEAPGNLEILRTILSLARTLGLDVVAEGVETEAQLASLRDMSCDFGQGFLFSRPVRPDQVDHLLHEEVALDPSLGAHDAPSL